MASNGNGHAAVEQKAASSFFTNLTTAGVQVAYAKIGLEGPPGSGKTTTGSLLAAGISRELCGGAPVIFPDSENGANFVRPIFVAEKIDLLHIPTRSLDTLMKSFREGIKAGACVAIVDTMTRFWTTLVSNYMKANGITSYKHMLSHWNAVKEPWREWTDLFLSSNLHVIVCGRGGFEYDSIDVIDDKGNLTTETVKGDNKMKAEGEFGHEPDVNLHFQAMTDPNAPKTGKMKRGKKGAVQLVAPRKIHVATVQKGRVWALNGKVFSWADRDTYKPGEYKEVLDCFRPYLDALNIGGTHNSVSAGENSFHRGESNGSHARKKKALEVWGATMSIIFPSQTTEDKQRRRLVGERITGTLSATAMGQQDVDAIEFQLMHLNKLRQRIEGGEGLPKLDKDLIQLIELAFTEASEDWKILHPPPPEPLTEEEMEQPF